VRAAHWPGTRDITPQKIKGSKTTTVKSTTATIAPFFYCSVLYVFEIGQHFDASLQVPQPTLLTACFLNSHMACIDTLPLCSINHADCRIFASVYEKIRNEPVICLGYSFKEVFP
jgi:hypothetical protein